MTGHITALTISEADVTPNLCQRCAKCCELELVVPSVDVRYRRLLRAAGFQISPPASDGQEDCCEKAHDITLHLGSCPHLRVSTDESGPLYSCELYASARRPQLCVQFNCVSWAKALNQYHLNNRTLVAAQAALNGLAAGIGPPISEAASSGPALSGSKRARASSQAARPGRKS